MNKIHCHICYSTNVDEEFICERCDQYYCEDCAAIFNSISQIDYNCCYECSDGNRIKPLHKDEIRNNKLKLIALF